MRRINAMKGLSALLGFIFFTHGCSSGYYEVRDPHSGNVYYTQKVDTYSSGSVKLKDDRSGNLVTLQSSEVKTIDSKAYEAGLKAAVTPPAAAPTPAPAHTPASPTEAPK